MSITYSGDGKIVLDALETALQSNSKYKRIFSSFGKLNIAFSALQGIASILGSLGEVAQGIESVYNLYNSISEGHVTPDEIRAELGKFHDQHKGLIYALAQINNNFSQSLSPNQTLNLQTFNEHQFVWSNLTNYGELKPLQTADLVGVNSNLVGLKTAIDAIALLLKHNDDGLGKIFHDNLMSWSEDLQTYLPRIPGLISTLENIGYNLTLIAQRLESIPGVEQAITAIGTALTNNHNAFIQHIVSIFETDVNLDNVNFVLNRICQAIIDFQPGGGQPGAGLTAEELLEVLMQVFTWTDPDEYVWTMPHMLMAILNGMAVYPRPLFPVI